jgi:magnesium transporter
VQVLTTLDEPRLRDLRARDEFFWIDLQSPSDDELDRLGTLLELHPVALEDTREFSQRPKLDVYDTHVLEGTGEEEFIVYRILDALTDAYYPVIAALEEQIDQLEADVLGRARREHLGRIYRLKQDVHNMQRIVTGQREQFLRGQESILGLAGLSKGSRAYLRDVGDHLVQVAGELQRQTEDLQSLTSTYFNANSDRLNAVATRVTIAGTLFVVWTLVTGFFGQNFGWLVDHIKSLHAFLIFGVGGFVVPTVILLTLFWTKRDEWF